MANFREENTLAQLHERFPVHFSCSEGNLNALSQLLNSGKFDLYEVDSVRGWTPAHWAANRGKLGCLMQLQSVGVNLNIATQRHHQTPLHVAAEAGHSTCVTFLLEQGVSLDIQDIQGETATHKAARNGHVDCLQLLRTHGGCFKFPFSVCNNQGQTPGELYQHSTAAVGTGPSRKRSSFEQEDEEAASAANKRPKFAASETLMEDAAAAVVPKDTTVDDYPMDFNEETMPQDHATAPSLFTSGENGYPAKQHPFQTTPDSSNTTLACVRGSGQEDMHDSQPDNNNSLTRELQGRVPFAPSSVVEHQAAVRAQYGYEKLCESAYEMQCYGHFF